MLWNLHDHLRLGSSISVLSFNTERLLGAGDSTNESLLFSLNWINADSLPEVVDRAGDPTLRVRDLVLRGVLGAPRDLAGDGILDCDMFHTAFITKWRNITQFECSFHPNSSWTILEQILSKCYQTSTKL